MQHRVACISNENIDSISQDPNNVIMTPVHDVIFKPWNVARVNSCIDDIIRLTKRGVSQDGVKQNDELLEFSKKYQTFFTKLTDLQFVNDDEHVETLKKIVAIKSLVDQGLIDESEGQKRCMDESLSTLMRRAKEQR